MTEIINMDAFIEIIAKRANFAKKDVKIILDTIVEIFTEVVVKGQILKIRGLGKLYTQIIPERKGNKDKYYLQQIESYLNYLKIFVMRSRVLTLIFPMTKTLTIFRDCGRIIVMWRTQLHRVNP